MKAISTMAARLMPAAASSREPSLVGTPVITSAAVMIDSVASNNARSQIISM